jgi:glycosyltransferase involved in cell wall biosynthesis
MTETLPKVSVVIATRERPILLQRAIRRVMEQTYAGEIEVVIVFDQSEPHPIEVDVPTGRTLTVIRNTERQPGLAGARNTGVLALDTDLVAFCDDDDEWLPGKLTAQVAALDDGCDFVTSAIEVRYRDRLVPRLAGTDRVEFDQLVRSRMAMLHASTFLVRRAALLDPDRLGLVAENAPGSQNEDWDLLLRAARRGHIRHVDEPLVQVRWGTTSHYAYEYATKISSLRWMMNRHPEIRGCPPGAARVYGQLACWSAATGNRSAAWRYARAAVRNNWREPRTAIAIAAVTRMVRVESVLGALHRRGRGI